MKKLHYLDTIISPTITEKATSLSEFNKNFYRYLQKNLLVETHDRQSIDACLRILHNYGKASIIHLSSLSKVKHAVLNSFLLTKRPSRFASRIVFCVI